MENDTLVKAQSREGTGTSNARRLRAAGWLPAVLNDVDGNAHVIQIDHHAFEMLLHHHSGESLLLKVQVDEDQPRTTILKEVQHEPISGDAVHADFKEIRMTEKLHVNIPIELTGDPSGVEEGGILDHGLRELEVECLPGDIVDSIPVDVSALKIGDSILVEDLTLDPKLTVLTAPSLAVASVLVPRLEEEEEEEAKEGEEGAEPEVIGEKPEGEGEKSESEE